MQSLRGIYTALLTPFDKDGGVDTAGLRRLVRYNLSLGVTGFYVCGSTAEAFLLSADERRLVMKTVAEEAKDAKLIAHVGALNEREAHALSDYANELSYNMISSVAPFYYKFSNAEIKDYYFRLAYGSDIPMLVYHIPAFSGVAMGVEEIGAFLEDSHFAGIKFTSNDFFTMQKCRARFPEKLIFNGYDEMFLCGLSMGADGAIGSTYNFMADKFVALKDAFLRGDVTTAQELQAEANRIITLLCQMGVMQAEKAILAELGICRADCRPPFGALVEEQKDVIRKQIIPFIKKSGEEIC